jgi:SAM-dependent methyltransferase
MKNDEQMDVFFAGRKLWGDNFSLSQIETWYEQERNAYSDLIGCSDGDSEQSPQMEYDYQYHAWNKLHGFRYLPDNDRYHSCLGLGAAYGYEFLPIIDQIDTIDILEPSQHFHKFTEIQGVPVRYHTPVPQGTIPFPDKNFDLITSLGCLHHIPNVSYVMSELYRVCRIGGYLFVRDPICSMGDWRQKRSGGTLNERGIPVGIFDAIIRDAGFTVCRRHFCSFPIVRRTCIEVLGIQPYNSLAISILDWWCSILMSWNMIYHRTTIWRKLAPGAVCYVLRRD